MLVANHAPLEGRGEKRLDPAHRKARPLFADVVPNDPEPVILTRAGDQRRPAARSTSTTPSDAELAGPRSAR